MMKEKMCYENGYNGFKITNVRVYDLYESMVAQGYPMMTGEFPDYQDKTLEYDKENKAIITKEYNVPGQPNCTYVAPKINVVRKVNENVMKSLAGCESGSGHDSFLKGIIVNFDVTYPVYWSPQFQRYHFADPVSSSSSMHRLTKMNMDESFTSNTPTWLKDQMANMIDVYNLANSMADKFGDRDGDLKIYVVEESLDDDTPPSYSATHESKLNDLTNEASNRGYKIEYFTIDEFYLRIVAACPQGLMKTMRITTNALQLKSMIKQRKNHKLPEWRVFCKVLGSLEFWDTIGYNPLKF